MQGHVVRINKDESQMDIRDAKTTTAGHLKKVAYDSSTNGRSLESPGNKTTSRKNRL